MSVEIKSGEIKCQAIYSSGKRKGEPCNNGAYFSIKRSKKDNRYFCGVHSRNMANREKLAKMTTDEKDEKNEKLLNEMDSKAKEIAIENKNKSLRGQVVLVRMTGMFPHVPMRAGWYNVYPNFKTNWQGIGINCPQLSPMSIGPITHGQLGLPDARNLENFHQHSKFFSEYETEEEFKRNQICGFKDDTPHRHKFAQKDGKIFLTSNPSAKLTTSKSEIVGKLGNIPDYFVWIDKEGKEHRLSGKKGYIESRQFYCNFYERSVIRNKKFKKLCKMIEDGYNLQICGPDAYPMLDSIEETYLDPSHPFGHERVLYTMLTSDESSWPWRKHKTFDF